MKRNKLNIKQIKETLRLEKSRVSIRNNEWFRYLKLVVWLYRLSWLRPEFKQFLDAIVRKRQLSGKKFTVSYLKNCHIALMKYLAKDTFIQGSPTIKVDDVGLPKIIPKRLRLLIRSEYLDVIRGVLSILTIYRVISFPGEAKLSTITDDSKGEKTLSMTELKDVAKLFPRLALKPREMPPMLISAGPNNSTSIFGCGLDALAMICKYPKVLVNYIAFAFGTGQQKLVYYLFLSGILISVPFLVNRVLGWSRPLRLGRLVEKPEPAGKIRIFAITDYWTQWLLQSVHDPVFSWLKKIPQDGTFNQTAPLELLKTLRRSDVFSFDLSAATDRLPIQLQKDILNIVFDTTIFGRWSKLLVERPWFYKDKPYFYKVGQPMGAYSSWASLALTHHFLVQLAAKRAGYDRWFVTYALLGDDIVIADKAVAMSYLSIMKTLDVKISEAKSLRSSNGVFEFAKRISSPACDYSPVGSANLVLALRGVKHLPTLIVDALDKGMILSRVAMIGLLKSYPFKITKGNLFLLVSYLGSDISPIGSKLAASVSQSRIESYWNMLVPSYSYNFYLRRLLVSSWLDTIQDNLYWIRDKEYWRWLDYPIETFKKTNHKRSLIGWLFYQGLRILGPSLWLDLLILVFKAPILRTLRGRYHKYLQVSVAEFSSLFNLGYWFMWWEIQRSADDYVVRGREFSKLLNKELGSPDLRSVWTLKSQEPNLFKYENTDWTRKVSPITELEFSRLSKVAVKELPNLRITKLPNGSPWFSRSVYNYIEKAELIPVDNRMSDP